MVLDKMGLIWFSYDGKKADRSFVKQISFMDLKSSKKVWLSETESQEFTVKGYPEVIFSSFSECAKILFFSPCIL